MAGTTAGGKAARDTNKKRYGADYYVKLGAKGGSISTTGGFYADRELARIAGAKGGAASRRGRALPEPEPVQAATPHKLFKFFKRSK